MLPATRIAFATDFSGCSACAKEHAFALAKALDATLDLVHVLETAPITYAGAEGAGLDLSAAYEAMRAQAERSMERLAGEATAQGLRAASHIALGRPHETILDAAMASGCDYIVIGTHGRSGVAHLLFGSVCERLIRLSTIPVLAVRHADGERTHPGEHLPIRRVLCPCDFSPLSEAALPVAAGLARRLGASLTLMHVIDTRAAYPPIAPEVAPPSLAQLHEYAAQRLFALANGLAGVEVSINCMTGMPHEEILSVMVENHVDLAIMATRGSGGLEHFLMGSTAEMVIRKAACPVMTVRPGPHEFREAERVVAPRVHHATAV